MLRLVVLVILLLSSGAISEEAKKQTYPYLQHEGQIQFQLNDGSLGSPKDSSFKPASNGLAPFPASDRLFVRRFRPVWKLHFSPDLYLDTEFDIDPQSLQISVADLFFNYSISEQTSLAVGRYKVPFGWEGLRTSRATNTVERSDATVFLYPERDLGITLTHQQKGVGEFSLGTFLGQPRSNGDANGGVDVIGRATFPLSESLSVGASGHLGNFRPTGSGVDIPVRRADLELQWDQDPIKFESEVLWSDGYNTASQSDTEAFGYYFAAVYRAADPLDFVLGYDRFDPDTNFVDSLQVSNSSNARDRKLIGANYYFSRAPVHRLMLNYEIRQSLEGPPSDSAGVRIRYQIAW